MTNGILRTIEGDVTNPQTSETREIVIIPHCCNNLKIMGSGVALALKKKWPLVYQVYNKMSAPSPHCLLGKVSYAKIDNHLVIANMIGQDGVVSSTNSKPIKYLALANAMREVVGFIKMIKTQTVNPVVIHSCKFGSDLAGGNWDFILELIREIWLENGIDVVIYEFVG
ncbi:hypothetical protein LCGC14_2478960 [marine sediment metagenome]|uniref:Macro domain-containing protein n=1 Tax=marine sediment metagenome TaxID=412755 RepID=A0A0F9BVV9_9ZZZZ